MTNELDQDVRHCAFCGVALLSKSPRAVMCKEHKGKLKAWLIKRGLYEYTFRKFGLCAGEYRIENYDDVGWCAGTRLSASAIAAEITAGSFDSGTVFARVGGKERYRLVGRKLVALPPLAAN